MSSSENLKQPVSAAKDPMDTTCIDTIRTLAMDAVQKANSGHPGTPMALGAGGLPALAVPPSIRSRRPGLAESRPVRPLGRPRVDAALLAPAFDRGPGGQ